MAAFFIFGIILDKTEHTLSIPIPENISQETKKIVTQTWPAVKQACPGLDLYASSLQFAGIDENFRYLPEDVQYISIKFDIPDNDKKIPTRSAVPQGNTCFFEISRNAKTLTVEKTACKEVCLAQSITGTAYENGPLIINLK